MTLDDLIDRLTEIRDYLEGDATVKCGYQPSYPLAANLSHVFVGDEHPKTNLGDDPPQIWLVLGDSCYDEPYAPRVIFDPHESTL